MCSRLSLSYAKKRQSYQIERIMVAKLMEAAPEETIGEAAKCMHETSVGCLVITREGAGAEISADRDLLFRFIRTERRLHFVC